MLVLSGTQCNEAFFGGNVYVQWISPLFLGGEDALSFVISSLTLVGMFAVVLYTVSPNNFWLK